MTFNQQLSRTCEPEHVLDREPGDADGLDHGEVGVVDRLAVSVLVHDAGNRVERHADRGDDDERDGDDAHHLMRETRDTVV